MPVTYHEKHLDKIDEKLEKITERLGNIDTTLAAQHVSLKEHIRRTGILEDKVEPIQKHVAMVSGALKLIGLIAMVGGIVEGVVALLSYVKG